MCAPTVDAATQRSPTALAVMRMGRMAAARTACVYRLHPLWRRVSTRFSPSSRIRPLACWRGSCATPTCRPTSSRSSMRGPRSPTTTPWPHSPGWRGASPTTSTAPCGCSMRCWRCSATTVPSPTLRTRPPARPWPRPPAPATRPGRSSHSSPPGRSRARSAGSSRPSALPPSSSIPPRSSQIPLALAASAWRPGVPGSPPRTTSTSTPPSCA